MPYPFATRIRVDLSADLGEGTYVEIRHPKLMPWTTLSSLFGGMQVEERPAIDEDGAPVLDAKGKPVTKSIQTLNPNAVFEIASGLILDWNLEDPDKPGEILPVPKDTGGYIPGFALIPIAVEVGRLLQEVAVPKG